MVSAQLNRSLRAAGFQKEDAETFARPGTEAEIVQRLYFEGIRGRGLKVSAAIRHYVVEETLAALYPSVCAAPTPFLDIASKTNTLGFELGVIPSRDLDWHTPIAWFDESESTIAEAVAFMDRVTTPVLPKLFAVPRTQRSNRETWAIPIGAQGTLRHLIVVELAQMLGIDIDSTVWGQIQDRLKTVRHEAWAPLMAMTFDELTSLIRDQIAARRSG